MYHLGGIMPFFHLDKEKCKKDGICSAVCVTGIIKNDDNHSPYINEKNAYKCISCGLCVAFCPHEACYVENLDPAQFSKVNKDTLASSEQLDTFIKTRRSVRIFRKNAVDDETLNKIMDNVRYAPSAKNTHNNRWIITKSREETVKLGDLVVKYMQEHPELTFEDAAHNLSVSVSSLHRWVKAYSSVDINNDNTSNIFRGSGNYSSDELF